VTMWGREGVRGSTTKMARDEDLSSSMSMSKGERGGGGASSALSLSSHAGRREAGGGRGTMMTFLGMERGEGHCQLSPSSSCTRKGFRGKGGRGMKMTMLGGRVTSSTSSTSTLLTPITTVEHSHSSVTSEKTGRRCFIRGCSSRHLPLTAMAVIIVAVVGASLTRLHCGG
jgi:hypothetical protein